MWLLHSTILNNIQYSLFLCPRLSVTLLFLLAGQSAEITALIYHVHMRPVGVCAGAATACKVRDLFCPQSHTNANLLKLFMSAVAVPYA